MEATEDDDEEEEDDEEGGHDRDHDHEHDHEHDHDDEDDEEEEENHVSGTKHGVPDIEMTEVEHTNGYANTNGVYRHHGGQPQQVDA